MNNEKAISKVYLLSVPLENDYKNTLYFNSKDSQTSYFQSKVVDSLKIEDSSYQRKDNIIRFPKGYDKISNVNYVMYQNSNYSNKWFYAFVTDLEYINDELTYIHIETDVIQTWLFDYTLKESFVEREHVSSDNVGEHTYPENLELGDFLVSSVSSSEIGVGHCVVSATYDIFRKKRAGGNINGIYQGVVYYLIGQDITAIDYLLNLYEDAGKIDAITGLFIVPDKLTNFENIEWDYMSTAGELSYYPYKKLDGNLLGTDETILTNAVIYKPYENINGYVPRNKKLFTYPYQYLLASNNNGGSAIYKYEYFSANPFSFRISGAISPGCSIKCYPRLYKGCDDNYDEGLNAGKYPICSYNTDMYTNWLTQNGVNIALNVASGVGQIVAGAGIALGSGGLGTAVGGGSIVGGVSTIASTLAQVHQMSFIPPQAEGNLNSGDVTYAMGQNEITFYKMTIKSEMAKIIDKYFDMFGYKVNLVKVPNKAHRSRWWFTKTIDVNIDGNIPMKDMAKIKECYNKGITFWRNASEIQNYSLTNNIAIIN